MAPRSCTRAPRGTPNSTPGSSVWSRKPEHTVGQASTPAAGLQTRRCTARDLTTSHQPRGALRALGTASFARRPGGPGGTARGSRAGPPAPGGGPLAAPSARQALRADERVLEDPRRTGVLPHLFSFAKIMACMTPNAELRQALSRARQQTDSLFDLVDRSAE